jgi:protein TonB
MPQPETSQPESPKLESPEPPALPKKAVELRKPEAPQPKKVSSKKKPAPAKVVQTPQAQAKETASESPVNTPPASPRPGEPGSSDRPAEGSNGGDGVISGGSKAEAGLHSKGMGLEGKEFQLTQVDKPPVVLSRVEPDYPSMARRRSINGQVTIKFLVDPQGRVQRPSIIKATPQGIFESSVLDAVARWRFKPGIYKGQAVSTWVILPIQFKLSG